MQALQWEKETLGIFVSGHPLADVADALARTGALPIKDVRGREDDAFVTIAGMVISVRRTLTKTGQQILIAQLEDMSASCEVVVFAKLYPNVQALFQADRILIVKGRLRMRERPGLRQMPDEKDAAPPVDLSVIVSEVTTFERPARRAAPPGWHVNVNTRDQIDRLAAVLEEWPGTVPVMARIGERSQRLPRGIAPDYRMKFELERIFGNGNVLEGLPE
jgi:DNA polymerase-3 subunit alpha